MQLLLCHREDDDDLGDAWKTAFGHAPNVRVVRQDITTVECDAIVSPANSFGFMDGGLDEALSNRFGWDLQTQVQARIRARPEGELLIGQAFTQPTGDARVPWVLVAPTMRVPMSFNIATSVNAYLAMKAILITAVAEPSIDVVAVPGLCTGVGRMPPSIAATQMYAAFDEVMLGKRLQFAGFEDAQNHQVALNPSGLIWDF